MLHGSKHTLSGQKMGENGKSAILMNLHKETFHGAIQHQILVQSFIYILLENQIDTIKT